MKLVEGWQRAYRWFSVQALALIAFLPILAVALPEVWLSMPDDLKAMLDPAVVKWVAAAIAVLGLIGRLIKQRDP